MNNQGRNNAEPRIETTAIQQALQSSFIIKHLCTLVSTCFGKAFTLINSLLIFDLCIINIKYI